MHYKYNICINRNIIFFIALGLCFDHDIMNHADSVIGA